MSTPFLRLGEFAHSPAIEIFNPYVALQDWTGSPGAAGRAGERFWLLERAAGLESLRQKQVKRWQRGGYCSRWSD